MENKTEVKVYEDKIDDLLHDENNLNKHTARGLKMLEQSIEDNGMGRSILTSSDGIVIAGNATLKSAKKQGISKVVTVEVGPDTMVNVKRTDIDSQSQTAKELALADNRVAEINLKWDYEAISNMHDISTLDKYDIKGAVTDGEMEAFFNNHSNQGEPKKAEGRHIIVLEYEEEKYNKVLNYLNSMEGKKEDIVYDSLFGESSQ